MRALLNYVRQTEVCLALAERLSENPIVQGVHVEPRPDLLWEWIAQRHEGGRNADPGRLLRGRLPLDVPTNPEFDFEEVSKWDSLIKDKRLPLLVRVHICPARADKNPADARRTAWSVASNFVSTVDVVFEDRARAIAAITPGDGVEESRPGTMGGMLRDTNNDVFGLTCAHIARHSQVVRDRAGVAIGTVEAASTLSPSPPNTLCRPSALGANLVDAALFRVDSAHVPLPSGLVASSAYGSGQRALMRGAKSGGPHSYYFGSIGLTQLVDIPGVQGTLQPHCFHLLSSIRAVPGPLRWIPWAGHQALQGDSGAFITDVGQALWFGMLCAVDGTEGFFLDATCVLQWACNASHRPALTPY